MTGSPSCLELNNWGAARPGTAAQFLSHRRAKRHRRTKHQAPNSKLQRSSKSENTKPRQMPGQTARNIGFWAWSLLPGNSASPKLRSARPAHHNFLFPPAPQRIRWRRISRRSQVGPVESTEHFMAKSLMRAVGVVPGKREVRLIEHRTPKIAGANQVKIRSLEVGAADTDFE